MQRVLGIVLEQVKKKDPEAWADWPEAEKIYQAWGSPLNEAQAIQVIESIQAEFRRRGLRYAGILLRCKVEMQQGRRVLIRPQPQPATIPVARVACLDCRQEYDGSANLVRWLGKHDCPNRPQSALIPDARKKVVGG